MTEIVPSLPVRFFRLFLEALNAELGDKALTAVLEKADLDPQLIDPEAVSRLTNVTAAETYARIQLALRVYYGRGARGTLLRIGRVMWGRLLDNASLAEKAQAQLARSLPSGLRLKAVLDLLARLMREKTADVTVHTLDVDLLLADHVGASTTGQKENAPICSVTLGLIQEALIWASGHEFDVNETSCRATGGNTCEFRVTISGK